MSLSSEEGTCRHSLKAEKYVETMGRRGVERGNGYQKFSFGHRPWKMSVRYSSADIIYVIKGLNLQIMGGVTVGEEKMWESSAYAWH